MGGGGKIDYLVAKHKFTRFIQKRFKILTERKQEREIKKEDRNERRNILVQVFGQSRVENLNTISSHFQVTLCSHTAGMLKEKSLHELSDDTAAGNE